MKKYKRKFEDVDVLKWNKAQEIDSFGKQGIIFITPDKKYKIFLQFVGNHRGFFGKLKEYAWVIGKLDHRNNYAWKGNGYRTYKDAMKFAQDRNDAYGYDNI